MNIPTKVLRSTYITYETYFHHQQLAKKFYKSSSKTRKGQIKEIDFKLDSEFFADKQSIKEDLLKWFFSLSLQDRIKAVSIENKWFSTMVQHMYLRFKYDHKIRFQLKLDDVSTEEYCLQIMNPVPSNFTNEMNLDNFFNIKNNTFICEDKGINENLFLKEIRYFTLREQNDTITLSTHLLENEEIFKFYLDTFSEKKAFQNFCTVSFDNVLKLYNWDFPEWFNSKDYNSISEFIIAYIEQILSIRYYFAMEDRREKILKNIPVSNFSLCEEPNFNEIFENRARLIEFLESEYGVNKEKLFNAVIDIKKNLQELRSDDSIMNKIKKPKPDTLKSCFYMYNNIPKFELFEPVKDNDYEIINKFKKLFIENTEEVFIDCLIFCKLDNLYTIEDFLANKIFQLILKIYADKNALDLMNEEFSLKKTNCDGKKKKNKKIKKKKSGNNSPKDDIDSNESIQLLSAQSTTVTTTPIHNEDLKKTDNGNMSWRKKPGNTALENNINNDQNSNFRKNGNNTSNQQFNYFKKNQTVNNCSKNDNCYVSSLVKTMLNQIITDESSKLVKEEKEKKIIKINESNEDNNILLLVNTHKSSETIDNKIETINHEIIPNDKKKMVDNYSQTEKKEIFDTNELNNNTEENIKEDKIENQEIRDPVQIKKKKKKKMSNFPIFNNFKQSPVEKKIEKQEKKFELKKSITKEQKKTISTGSEVNQKKNSNNIEYNYNDYDQYDQYDYEYEYNDDYKNKNYYKSYFGNKRNKFGNTLYNNNKFNNGDNIANKQINNRSYYSRDYIGYEDYPKNQIFNNYFIINSNVNFNNVTKSNDDYDEFNQNIYNNYMFNNSEFLPNYKLKKEDNYNNNILSKFDEVMYPFIFHYKVHNDIVDYSKSVSDASEYLKDIKLYIIKYLENAIKSALETDVIIDLYGSFATNLSIESSDIDITIKFNDEKDELAIEDLINKLCYYFSNLNLFETINPILKATVPVVKLLIDPLKILDDNSKEYKKFVNFKNSEIFKNYKFDIDELLKVKVDLTFIELYSNYSTKDVLDWAKTTLDIHPEIKPIVQVLKRYLQTKKLNSSFNGGLSSFSLLLLIIAYLKYPKAKTKTNLGRILIEFLELYGKFYNYSQSIIDVNLLNPFIITNEYIEDSPVIIDPITGKNVAKNSFRMDEVRESFSSCYDYLNNSKILFDKKDLSLSTNIIIELMLNSKTK